MTERRPPATAAGEGPPIPGVPALPALPELPRVRLLDGPTPLQPLPRLSAALGGATELWVKREDLGPLAFSGNKLRNLEFLLGAALAAGADTVVTAGRRWSNHCRLTAAAGSRLGLRVHVVVNGPPVDGSPNIALMRELGAEVHVARTEDRSERDDLVAAVAAAETAAGRNVRVLPVGGSESAGAWGQVLAALEAFEQAAAGGLRPGTIVLPTATGGTQAGLTVGSAIAAIGAEASVPTRVLGIAVHPDPTLEAKVQALVGSLAGMAGVEVDPSAVELDTSQLGTGYGVPTPQSTAATELLARTEGILVDPVYGAKALAGLVAAVRAGDLGDSAILWHGGGLPALFEPRLGAGPG